MKQKFKVGDKVKLTDEGKRHLIDIGASEYANVIWRITKYDEHDAITETPTGQDWHTTIPDFNRYFKLHKQSWEAAILGEHK